VSLKPRVGIYIPQEPEMHVEVLEAFATGLEKTQTPFFRASLNDGWKQCDVCVTFGVNKNATTRGQLVGKVLQAHRRSGGRSLIIERGFLHREHYFMVGWDGLNGRADYANANSPGDRWAELNIEVRPWRTSGEHIVLSGQVPWDASVQHTDHIRWCQDTAKTLERLTQRPVVFRPHPCQPSAIDMSSTQVRYSRAQTLQEDLQNAWALITFNSNSGVEGAIQGCPVFAFDPGSMASDIANRLLKHIEQPQMPDRTQWLHNLAYTQWTTAEMEQGLAWSHIRKEGRFHQKATFAGWFKKWMPQRAA